MYNCYRKPPHLPHKRNSTNRYRVGAKKNATRVKQWDKLQQKKKKKEAKEAKDAKNNAKMAEQWGVLMYSDMVNRNYGKPMPIRSWSFNPRTGFWTDIDLTPEASSGEGGGGRW